MPGARRLEAQDIVYLASLRKFMPEHLGHGDIDAYGAEALV
jgi:hypothetical protein